MHLHSYSGCTCVLVNATTNSQQLHSNEWRDLVLSNHKWPLIHGAQCLGFQQLPSVGGEGVGHRGHKHIKVVRPKATSPKGEASWDSGAADRSSSQPEPYPALSTHLGSPRPPKGSPGPPGSWLQSIWKAGQEKDLAGPGMTGHGKKNARATTPPKFKKQWSLKGLAHALAHWHGDALAGDKQQTGSQPRKSKLWDVPGVATGQCPAKGPSPRARATRGQMPCKKRDLARKHAQLGPAVRQRRRPDKQARVASWLAKRATQLAQGTEDQFKTRHPAQSRRAWWRIWSQADSLRYGLGIPAHHHLSRPRHPSPTTPTTTRGRCATHKAERHC